MLKVMNDVTEFILGKEESLLDKKKGLWVLQQMQLNLNVNILEGKRKMPQRNKSKRTYRRKNIDGNFRGAEDIFMRKVRDGFIKFLESPFKWYW